MTNGAIRIGELHRIRCWTCTETTRAVPVVAAAAAVAVAVAVAAGGDGCDDDDGDNVQTTTLTGFRGPAATTLDCSRCRRSRNRQHRTSLVGDFQRRIYTKCQHLLQRNA